MPSSAPNDKRHGSPTLAKLSTKGAVSGNFFPWREWLSGMRTGVKAGIKEWGAELLFPRKCVGCDRGETFLCEDCQRKIPRKASQNCPSCLSVDTPFGQTCLRCSKKYALDGVLSATSFQDNPILQEAVHVFKYEFVEELAHPLGMLLGDVVRASDMPLPDRLIPVPLHPLRERFRGFNQSALLADILAAEIALELLSVDKNLLVRHRFTLPQARSKNKQARKDNLEGAFRLSQAEGAAKSVRGKTFWLIDDVATTGATLEACARVLKEHGAKKVFGIVVAR